MGTYAPRRAGRRGASDGRGCWRGTSIKPWAHVVRAVWVTISAIASVRPRARRVFVTVGRESSAAAGRLALALWDNAAERRRSCHFRALLRCATRGD
jgi:hypothetical protein